MFNSLMLKHPDSKAGKENHASHKQVSYAEMGQVEEKINGAKAPLNLWR